MKKNMSAFGGSATGGKKIILLSTILLGLFVLSTTAFAAEKVIVTGTVTYPDSSPLAGVVMNLHNGNGSISIDAATDASGAFSISGDEDELNGEGLSVEFTIPDGYFRPTNYALNFTYALGDDARTVDYVLRDAPKTVNVTVRDNNGNLVNADVTATKIGNETLSVTGYTGDDGQITLYLIRGEYVVSVDANLSSTDPDFYTWMFTGKAQTVSFNVDDLNESADFEFTVDKAYSKVGVIFKDASGNILTGNSFAADVTFIRSDGVSTRRKVNSEGKAQAWLLPGTYRAWPMHQQIDATQTFIDNTFVVVDGENKDLGVIQAVVKGSTITGRLVDKNDNALSNVQMLLNRKSTPEREDITTDADGTFTFTVGPGEYSLGLGDTGLAASYKLLSTKTVQVASNDETIDLGSIKAYGVDMTISGSVTCNGNDVEGMVVASSANNSYYSAIDADGSYTVSLPTELIDANTLAIDVVTQPGTDCYLDELGEAEVSATNVTKELVLTAENAVISGHLTDMEGNNLTDFGTNLEVVATSTNGSVEKSTVDANGAYSMTVAPGKWIVAIDLDSEDDATVIPVAGNYLSVVAEEDQTKTLNIPLFEKEATITGSVKDNNNIALASVPVIATNLTTVTERNKLVYVSGLTDKEGNYSLSVPSGGFTVNAGSSPDVADLLEPQAQDVTMATGDSETVNLSYRTADLTLSGTVTAVKDIVSGKVVAYSNDGGYVESNINANGEYSLSLNEGTWSVVASGLVNNYLYTSVQTAQTITTDTDLDLELINVGQKVPATASATGNAEDLIAVGNELGVSAIIEPYGAVLSGEVSVDLIPVPEVLPNAEGMQASIAYELRVISDDKEVTQLKRPATISMPINEYGLIKNRKIDEDRLAAQYWSPEEELWQPSGVIGVVNVKNDKVILHVDHLTQFSLLSASQKVKKPGRITHVRVPAKYLRETRARVKWHGRANADNYKVELRSSAGNKLKTYITDIKQKTIKKHLQAGKSYKVRVRGVSYWGQKGKWSHYRNFQTISQ